MARGDIMPENAIHKLEAPVKVLMPDIFSDGGNTLDIANLIKNYDDNLPIIRDLSTGVHELFEIFELIGRLDRVRKNAADE